MEGKSNRTIAIVQARLGSTRLPGKVMLDLEGKPVLVRCLERLLRSRILDGVVVATTNNPDDQPIIALCQQMGWRCYQGSETDLLDRYYQTALAESADIVVRCTSDCPFIDPNLVDDVVDSFINHLPSYDYASTRLPKYLYPIGLDTEVMTMKALTKAWKEDGNPAWREHVTPYIYNHPEIFRLLGHPAPKNYHHYRITVDTYEDLELAKKIYAHFGHDRFTWMEIIAFLNQRPDLAALNAEVTQKYVERYE